MSLLLPIFIGAGALIGLPILLHLLRTRPRRSIPFPSLAFLGLDALRDSNRHRIRRWLTLLLRCLAILAIVLAFSRPYWRFEHSEASRAVVVVVDNSYSMQATGRRAAVEAWLAPQLAALRQPDELGVLLLHPTPTWLVPLGDDLVAGRKVLEALPEGFETSRFRAGIELAAAKLALSTRKQKQIWLAADQQRLGWNGVRFERTLPPGIELVSAPVMPAPKRQAAITVLKAARAGEGRVTLEATVRGFSAGRDERTVTFYAGGEKLGTQRCVLTDGRPQTVQADYAVPDAHAPLMLHVAIDADELPVDDTAYATLAATNDRRVLLAGAPRAEEADFLALALGAVRGEKLPTYRVEPLPAAGTAWNPASVAVLRGGKPFARDAIAALEGFLAAGGSAWIHCDGSPEQSAWLARHGIVALPVRAMAGGKTKLRDLALEHPLFAPFVGHSIAPVLAPTFRRAWFFTGDAVEPLARWSDRTVAIAEARLLAGRLLLTGFDDARANSSFPIEAGYVPFVHHAATWLAQNPSAAVASRVGAMLVLPGAGTWRTVLSPKPAPPVEVNGHVTPAVPGIYAFEQAGQTKQLYAVNLETAESDLTPWPTPGDFARLVNPEKESMPRVARAPTTPLADAALVDERHAWWWLIVAAIGLLFLELAIANRTVL